MISVNDLKIERAYFPDGSQNMTKYQSVINHVKEIIRTGQHNIVIKWTYEGDEEFVTLKFLMHYFHETLDSNINYILKLWYCPNARMDRIKHNGEIFTLKFFAKELNEMKFSSVLVLDAHSDVSLALIDNVINCSPENAIKQSINDIFSHSSASVENLVLFFPDAGAMKRYSNVECLKSYPMYYGSKIREWETGEIKGLKIFNRDDERIDGTLDPELKGKVVLMIDDIISYGGTLYHSARKLKDLGADMIFAYASHTENSVLNKEKGTFLKVLEDGTVNMLYTTDSVFQGGHSKISVLNLA